jgi:hypothetical protein
MSIMPIRILTQRRPRNRAALSQITTSSPSHNPIHLL